MTDFEMMCLSADFVTYWIVKQQQPPFIIPRIFDILCFINEEHLEHAAQPIESKLLFAERIRDNYMKIIQ